MGASYRDQTKSQNLDTDKVVGMRGSIKESAAVNNPLTEAICTRARRLWPHKTAQHLALHADIGHRQAERMLGGRQQITWPALKALLTSEHASGFFWLFLESFGEHEFWSDLRKKLRKENLKEQIRELQNELKQEEKE